MTDWSLVGGDPVPGQPDAISGVARRLAETAEAAGDAERKLRRLHNGADDSIWRGRAADAFRDRIDELPDQLLKLQASYGAAAGALSDYSGALRALQGEATTAVSCATMADDDRLRAEQDCSRALAAAPDQPPVAADAALAQARARLDTARREVAEIRGRRRTAEDTCVRQLEQAGDKGIQNERFAFAKRTLRAIGDACDIIAFVLTVIAIVVVVAVLLATPGVGWAALGAALAAAAPLFKAIFVLGVISLAAGSGRRLMGDSGVTLPGLAFDAALLFVPGRAGNLLGRSRSLGAVRDLRVATTTVSRVTEATRLTRLTPLAGGRALLVSTREFQVTRTVVRIAEFRLPVQTLRGSLLQEIPERAADLYQAGSWAVEEGGERLNPIMASVAAAASPPGFAVAGAAGALRTVSGSWTALPSGGGGAP